MKKHLLLFALLLLISETMFGQEQGFNISVYTDPSNGVGGSAYVGNTQSQTDSTFHYNDICTIHAIANESAGYHFVKWTAGDGIEIQEPEYAFYVTQDSSFIAHFALTDFAITYTNNGNGSCSGNPTAHFNEEVTVTVTPETGYELNMLTYTPDGGIAIDITSSKSFTMPASNVTVNATFTLTDFAITYTNNGNGSCSGNPTAHFNEEVTVTVTPETGYELNMLTYTPDGGTAIDITSSMSFTMPASAVTVHATFTQIHTITVSANPTNGGAPYVGSTSGTTQGTFTHGHSCTVHANPNPGYTFQRWTENNNQVSTQADYSFTVTSNRNLVAYFTQQQCIITVLASPTNGGTVTGSGAYHYGDQVNIGATANDGFEFVGWNDGNTNNPRTITVMDNATYTAQFDEVGITYYHVTAIVEPEGAGEVTGTGNFQAGSTTQLRAIANNGYTFSHWQDGSDVNPRTVTVNSSMEFTAYFNPIQYTISVSAIPTNGGSPYVGNSYNQQSGTYSYGQTCTVHANPSLGYTFTNWTENGTVVWEYANYPFQVTGNRNLVANYTQAGLAEYTITTIVNPNGSGTVEGGGTYPSGTQVDLKAIPEDGYTFDHWQDGDNHNPRTITVTGNAIYTATFKQGEYTITTKVTPEGSGRVNGGGNGFHYGDQTILTANANNGYTFDHWQDGDNHNPRTITVHSDSTFTAHFEKKKYTITVEANNNAWGTVSGGGIFDYGETTELTATNHSGYEFMGWDDGITDNPREITVTCDSTFVAIFDVEGSTYYNVTTTVAPIGAGRVTGGGTYPGNTNTTLTAIENIGYTFSHWQDGNTDNPRSYTVNESMLFTAHFTTNTYTINVIANPEEGGTVIGDGPYAYGVDCTLKARSKPGYTFINWTENGIVVSTNDTYTFTVEHDRNLIANFTLDQQYTITVIVNPENGGTVTGDGLYAYGTTCTLAATPKNGYKFDNWKMNGAVVSTDSEYSFEVTGDATYTAYFSEIPVTNFTIITEVTPTDAGIVTGGGQYAAGTSIELTATANLGYTFVHWDDGNTDNPRTVIVNSDMKFVAIFEKDSCIENLEKIAVKNHTDGDNTYALILVYPNLDNEDYTYKWLYSVDSLNYRYITEKTDKPYYYKEGGLDKGYYKVRIFKDDDCSAVTEPIYVGNSTKNLNIYPNPSRRGNSIVVMHDSEGPAQLTIYSMDGRLLHTQMVTDNQAVIDIKLPQGVYVAYFTNSEGYTKVGKLIIQ